MSVQHWPNAILSRKRKVGGITLAYAGPVGQRTYALDHYRTNRWQLRRPDKRHRANVIY